LHIYSVQKELLFPSNHIVLRSSFILSCKRSITTPQQQETISTRHSTTNNSEEQQGTTIDNNEQQRAQTTTTSISTTHLFPGRQKTRSNVSML
jgi:hypothetical protein